MKQGDFGNIGTRLAYGIGSPADGMETPLPRPDARLPDLMAEYLGGRKTEEPTKSLLSGVSAPLPEFGLDNTMANVVPIRPLDFTPAFNARVIPAKDTITSFPQPIPNGNTGEQLDTIRDALRRVESHGNYQAKNPTTSASGAYQNTNGNWGGYGGYAEARFAPKAVQDAKANEDIIKSLRRFNGNPFAVIANHMLPSQALKPWLWATPSYIRVGKGNKSKVVTIPPVIDYVRKVVKGTPYENQLDAYMAPHLPRGVSG